MKFKTEKTKDGKFRVVNDTTGMVRGLHKTEAEAKAQAQALQKTHTIGIQMASAKIIPPKDVATD